MQVFAPQVMQLPCVQRERASEVGNRVTAIKKATGARS